MASSVGFGLLNLPTFWTVALAIGFLAVGLFFCLAGKKYFRLFLAFMGFVFGVSVAIAGLTLVASIFKIKNMDSGTPWAVVLVSAIAGTFLFYSMWRLALFASAAWMGYMIMAHLFAIPILADLFHDYVKIVCTIVAAVSAIILMHYFEVILSVVLSATIGAILSMLSIDAFVHQGYFKALESAALHLSVKKATMSAGAHFMVAGTLALAVIGVVVQTLNLLPCIGN